MRVYDKYMAEPTPPEQRPPDVEPDYEGIEGGSRRDSTSLDDFAPLGPDRFGPPVDGKKPVIDGGSTGPKTPLTPTEKG